MVDVTRSNSSNSETPAVCGSDEAGASAVRDPAVTQTRDVTSSDSSTREPPAVGGSDEAGASAVRDPAVTQKRRQRQTREMPPIRGTARAASRGRKEIQNIQGEAAKPMRQLQRRKRKRRLTVEVQEQPREAAVGASRGSGEPPFEDESQENQLPSLRAHVREHAAMGGAPHLFRQNMSDSHRSRPLAASLPLVPKVARRIGRRSETSVKNEP